MRASVGPKLGCPAKQAPAIASTAPGGTMGSAADFPPTCGVPSLVRARHHQAPSCFRSRSLALLALPNLAARPLCGRNSTGERASTAMPS